jgi:hypothetical protein
MSIEESKPIPEETQKPEETINDRREDISLEQERVNKEGAKVSLLRYAQELNYDDLCDGRAVRTFRKHLETIAKHTEELESAGYKVRVQCQPKVNGSASVRLEYRRDALEIYSEFYSTYSNGFTELNPSVSGIEENIRAALKMAEALKIRKDS